MQNVSLKKPLALLVVAILTVGVFACSLFSCAPKPEDAAKEALETYLGTIKKGTIENFEDLAATDMTHAIDANLDSEEMKSLITTWIDGFSYEVGNGTMDGADLCTLPVKITCRDMAKAIASSVGELFTYGLGQALSGTDQATINQHYYEIIEKNLQNTEPTTTETSVSMQLVDGRWAPTEEGGQAILNAMTGNLSALQNALSQYAS